MRITQTVPALTASVAPDSNSNGAVLLEALTGRAPFEDEEDSFATTDEEEPELYPQLTARAPRVRSLRPRLPASLASVVDGCLEPDPSHRPSVSELAAALETVPGAGSPRAVRSAA